MGTATHRGHGATSAVLAAALIVGLVGLIAAKPGGAEEPADNDQLINITVKDADVAQVLAMIARASGVNIAVGDEVKGRLKTVTLNGVTAEEALLNICAAANLYWRKLAGNTYVISAQPVATSVPVPPVSPGVVPVEPVTPPSATAPSSPAGGSEVKPGGPEAPGPVVSPPSVVVSGPGGRDIVTASLEVKYVDAGRIAEMFGGSRVQDGHITFATPRSWRGTPYTRTRINGSLDRTLGGFTEMSAPGAPGGVGRGAEQFPGGMGGGFGAPGGTFGGGGFGGGAFGGGLGGRFGGGALGGGAFGGGFGGGLGGGAAGGGFAQLLPDGMMPPIAYMPLNVLIVRGTQEAIDQFKEVLALLDQQTKQVSISTKFVQVETTLDKAFGIDFFVDNGSLGFFNVGLAPATGLTVVRFTRGRFTAELRTLLNEGRAQIINEPRVTTQNNLPAEVQFSTTIPYYSATITYNEFGFRQVDYEVDEVDVTSGLFVTPRINKDDTVTLDLQPQVEEQVGTVVGPDGQTIPIVTSQYVFTRVTVADGETLAIGGLIRRNDSVSLHKTPLLSDIPIIGNLFTGKTKTTRNSELVILVTPQIVRELPRD